MIEEQIQVSLSTMPSGPGIVKTLEIAYKKLMGLSQGDYSDSKTSLADIKSTFWRLYKGMEENLLAKEEPSTALTSFRPLADELNCYRAFSLANGWNAEADRSVVFFKNAVRRFLATTDSTAGFVEDLKVVYTAMKEFSLEAEDSPTVQVLKETFEKSFEKLTTEAFEYFTSTDTVQLLSVLVDELVAYNSLAIEAGWTSERSAVGTRFKGLVLKQICTLVELACKDCSPQGISYGKYSESRAFADFSWLDWKLCLRSILLLRYDRQFCFDFGREMVLIECLLEINPRSEATVDYNDKKCPQCNRCLDFNRVCTYCRALVNPHTSKCLAGNCSSQLSYYSGAYLYRCQSCCRHQIRASANNETAVKQFCPNCLDQELDYNRRCVKCKVFFRPEPEHKVTPVCPWDGSALEESSGKCHSRRLVWKYFPKPTRSVKFDGNRLTLPGKQFELAVEVSSSLSDPNHFGHLAWRYCEFMATATEGQRG